MEPKLRLININKKFGTKSVLEDVSFDVQAGEFVSMLGSSGCGKTTLLRIIMGIESPDTGSILKDGKDITQAKPKDRGMGIVFQNYALFPNMNVYDNIAFALKCRHLPKEDIQKRVEETIQIVGLQDHVFKKPSMLSGGQQQRVAIARTIVLNPDIILFDEPMAALDADIRMSLRKELKALQKRLKITMIYVTHDQEEAFSMSDRILVMNDSVIAQLGTPHEIYANPKNEFVRRFVVQHLNEKVTSIEQHIK
jgi:iron(III) transport system ATP-binding protein